VRFPVSHSTAYNHVPVHFSVWGCVFRLPLCTGPMPAVTCLPKVRSSSHLDAYWFPIPLFFLESCYTRPMVRLRVASYYAITSTFPPPDVRFLSRLLRVRQYTWVRFSALCHDMLRCFLVSISLDLVLVCVPLFICTAVALSVGSHLCSHRYPSIVSRYSGRQCLLGDSPRSRNKGHSLCGLFRPPVHPHPCAGVPSGALELRGNHV